jgi:hypothetical protein
MSKTHFPRAGGTRWIDSFYRPPFAVGNVFFVSSATGTDTAGYGFSPEAPFASIAFAITQCVANNGDLILVLPGHTETITAAAGVAVNVAGVTIQGLGAGRSRANVNYTTSASASFDITAANVLIDNLVFTPTGVASVTAAINVQAAGVTIQNCEIELATATNQAVLGVLTNASANRFTFQNNHVHGTNNAGTTAAVKLVGGSDIKILNNVFQGAYSAGVGAIQQTTTDTVNCIVYGNVIQNLTASSTKAMVFTSGSTGQISENLMQILSSTAPITGTAMSWVGANYYANALATAGTLI